jgi:hypothetical protein
MASKDVSKRLHAVTTGAFPARVDKAGGRLDTTFPVARALADALKVLTALERSVSHGDRPGMATGNGYADGYAVIDATMPDLASHLRGLIEQMEQDANTIREEYESLAQSRAEVAHG